MPVDATWRLQSNSGSITGSSFTATLPNPTQVGSTLLMFILTGAGTLAPQLQSFDPPFFQDLGASGKFFVWRRDTEPGGETSWAVTAGISDFYYWRIEEWTGLSSIAQPDANTSLVPGTGNPVSTNTASPDVSDFAALAAFKGTMGSGATGYPSGRSYTSGWAEVAWMTNGTGALGDYGLAIAEYYPGSSASLSCTITWSNSGGGSIPSGTDAWMACYRPAAAAPPTGVLTS